VRQGVRATRRAVAYLGPDVFVIRARYKVDLEQIDAQ